MSNDHPKLVVIDGLFNLEGFECLTMEEDGVAGFYKAHLDGDEKIVLSLNSMDYGTTATGDRKIRI